MQVLLYKIALSQKGSMAGDRDRTRVQLFEDVKVLLKRMAEYEEQNTKYNDWLK